MEEDEKEEGPGLDEPHAQEVGGMRWCARIDAGSFSAQPDYFDARGEPLPRPNWPQRDQGKRKVYKKETRSELQERYQDG